jgi:DNA-binding response OmpR family regulator
MNRALLVDDDPAHRLMARRALLRADAQIVIVEADSLRGGISSYNNDSFHLVVVDLNLAGTSGLDLIRHARGIHSAVPIIAISTSSLEADVAAAYRAGADIFVFKADGARSFPIDLAAAAAYLLKP